MPTVKGEVLTMFEAAAGEQDRQILRVVAVAVAQIAPEENHRVVEERHGVFVRLLQSLEELVELLELCQFQIAELGELVGSVAVV